MAKNETILVTGATGQQGGAVARPLLQKGQKVRALTRNAAKAEALKKMGAEVVTGSLTDRAAMDAALRGVKKVFLVTTPFEDGLEAEVRQGITVADAAMAAGVDHLVYSSVGSAARNTGIPHFETKWKVEQHIKKIGIPATILRPVWFMENIRAPWLAPMVKSGKVVLPIRPDLNHQMISLDDIGAFAAAAILGSKDFIGQAIELAGDEMTFPESLKLVSQAIGRTVTYERLPDEQSEKTWGHDFAVMFRWFNDVGYNVDIPALQKRWGIPLTKFKDLLAKAPWVKQL